LPIEVAREGMALVVSKSNDFATCLSLAQARAIWRRADPATSWADVNAAYPTIDLKPVGWKPESPPYTLLAQGLFGPIDPLTRDDYEVAGDSAELAEAVAASPGGVGYLPVGKLRRAVGVRPLAVDAGGGCVTPTVASVRDGSYRRLSRRLYLDVAVGSMRRPEARRFVREYLENPPPVATAPGAIEVPASHRIYRKFTRP
jgi:phosphate transport system substrate-binding protein